MGVCVSLTHYCVCLCVCVCVCLCVCGKHLHKVPYKYGCKNSWITCSLKVWSCFLKPKLFNVFIDFKSFNFFWWIGPSTWGLTSASPWQLCLLYLIVRFPWQAFFSFLRVFRHLFRFYFQFRNRAMEVKMASLQHRRRNKISLHHGNPLKYSDLNKDGSTKTVKWHTENNECCEENTILSRSAWSNIKNERKEQNVWNQKFFVGFSHSCMWAWVWSWMHETNTKYIRLGRSGIAVFSSAGNCFMAQISWKNKRFL